MALIEVQTVELSAGYIETLYLNHPATRNSFTLEMGLAFNRKLHDLASREILPRALIITGRNDVFSSGGDLDLLQSFSTKTPAENREFMLAFYRLFLSVRDMPFVVIAAVNGHAIGASLALSLACDLRYFVPDGKYAFNFVRLGIHPGMGASFLVKEAVGMAQAQELLLTGRMFSGEEAYTRGICHGLFPRAEIQEGVLGVAREIASSAPMAVRMAKKGLYLKQDLDSALEYEARSQAENFASEDFREALKAIGEKRQPLFRDR